MAWVVSSIGLPLVRPHRALTWSKPPTQDDRGFQEVGLRWIYALSGTNGLGSVMRL